MYQQIFEQHAELLKALAHPRRLEILNLLRDQELCVSDIHQMLDLPQANVSQHLRLLREIKVLKTRKKGKQIYYQVIRPQFIEACDLIRQILIDQNTDHVPTELMKPLAELVPLVHDPVCQMRISPKTASFQTEYQNKNYYFCASGCYHQFVTHPEKYAQTK